MFSERDYPLSCCSKFFPRHKANSWADLTEYVKTQCYPSGQLEILPQSKSAISSGANNGRVADDDDTKGQKMKPMTFENELEVGHTDELSNKSRKVRQSDGDSFDECELPFSDGLNSINSRAQISI